jgi:alkylhydroperoxidase family enzyme
MAGTFQRGNFPTTEAGLGSAVQISYRESVRTPLGTITKYDGPAENTEPPKLLLAVGHPAAVADNCLAFFRTLVNGALTTRDRKLVTLAVAAAIENAYEWGHHTATALQMDISQGDLDAIKSGETERLGEHDQVVVEVSQAVERQDVSDQLWARAEKEFDTEQLVQLTVISAYYGMLGRIQTALQVDQDEGFSAHY